MPVPMIDLMYERFERGVGLLLTAGMGIVILFATAYFAFGLVEVVAEDGLRADYETFQNLFERVLAVVIALELARSVHEIAAGRHGLTQVRTVVLIGVLAVVRKLIIFDIEAANGLFLLGLAAAILALGSVYAMTILAESRAKTGELDI